MNPLPGYREVDLQPKHETTFDEDINIDQMMEEIFGKVSSDEMKRYREQMARVRARAAADPEWARDQLTLMLEESGAPTSRRYSFAGILGIEIGSLPK